MAISLTSFTPNTKAQSGQVTTNFNAVKSGIEDSAYRGFSWGISGTLSTGDEQGMKYIVPQGVTVKKIWAKTGSGTATIRIQKDTTDIISGYSVSGTVGSSTTFSSTTVTAGQVLTFDITAVSSAVDVFILLETRVTTID